MASDFIDNPYGGEFVKKICQKGKMPRLTEILLHKKPIKRFNNYRPVPLYRERYPALLKNEVSLKGMNKKGNLIVYTHRHGLAQNHRKRFEL